MSQEHRSEMRLPTEVHDKLVEAARLSGNSKNAEVIQRLRNSFDLDNANRLADRIDALSKAVTQQQKQTNQVITLLAEALLATSNTLDTDSKQRLVDSLRALTQNNPTP